MAKADLTELHDEESTLVQLTTRIYEKTSYAKATVSAVVREVFKLMGDMLEEGQVLHLPRIGKLFVKVPDKPTRLHHNWVTKQWEHGVAKKHVRFKEATIAYERVNGLHNGKKV